jgi:hypothetical protein
VGYEMSEFVRERQDLPFEAQSSAQHDASSLDTPQYPTRQRIPDHGGPAVHGKLLQAIDVKLQMHGASLACK